jgi:Phage integrase, N-terminal SAM-like domain
VEEKREVAAKALTFEQVAERYVREYVERNNAPKTAGEVRRILSHDIIPVLGQRPIREIARADVNDLLVFCL